MQNILGMIAIAGIAATCSARPILQESHGQSKSTISMQSSDGKDSYEVRIQDGKVTAKVNGEEIPADRVVRTKNGDHETVEIHDENGNVVKTFELNAGNINFAPFARAGNLRSAAAPKAARGGFRAVEPAEAVDVVAPEADNPPPVMVGVTMSEPDPSVLEFLKLEKGVLFDRVIDDLPAAKAGVKVGDILVEVKGEKNISSERFREILRGLKAGDSLDMKVARAGGEIHPVTLSLVAFDAKALGRIEKQAEGDGSWDVVTHQGAQKYWENAQKALEKAMKDIKDNPNLQSDAVKKSVEESLAKAMDSLKQAKDSLRDVQIFSNNGQWAPQATTRFRLRPGQNGAVVVPPNITPDVPDVDDGRIQKLEKKVDDLNKKLDKIAKMLEDRK